MWRHAGNQSTESSDQQRENCQAININRPNRAGERRSDQNAQEGKARHHGRRLAAEHQGKAVQEPAAVYLK